VKIFYSNALENQLKVDQSWFKTLDCSMPSPYDGLTMELLAHLVSALSLPTGIRVIMASFSGFSEEIHPGLVKTNGSE